MKNKILFVILSVLLIVVSGCSIDDDNGLSGKGDKYDEVPDKYNLPEKVLLKDVTDFKTLKSGEQIVKKGSKEMFIYPLESVEKLNNKKAENVKEEFVISGASQEVIVDECYFEISASTDIVEVGPFEETKKWEYYGSGINNELVSSNCPLINVGDSICILKEFEQTDGTLNRQVTCIYYPPQITNTTEPVNVTLYNVSVDDVFYDNYTFVQDWSLKETRLFERVSSSSFNVSFIDYYDPLITGPINLSSVVLSSEGGLNTTNRDLSVSYNATSESYVVTDWRKDNVSIAVFNMPFALNSSTTAKDYSTNEVGCNVTNAAYSSVRGGSYLFDASADNYISCGIINPGDNVTISFWLNASTTGEDWNRIFWWGDDNGIMIAQRSSSEVMELRVDTTTDNYQNPFSGVFGSGYYGEWHHVAVTLSNGVAKAYFDGVNVKNGTYTGTFASTEPLRLGADLSGEDDYAGYLDDVLIFDSVLSDDEVAALYASGLENESLETLPSSFTSVGDYWSVNVTASNTTSEVSILSNQLYIRNSCIYGSGNFLVDCYDNCAITSGIDVGGNNISISGTGTFSTTANITNFGRLYIEGIDASNQCVVTCTGGGCFQNG